MKEEIKPSWYKQAIEGSGSSCLCCPDTSEILPLGTKIYNGFGGWSINKNGEHFYSAENGLDWDDFKDISYIEELIGEDTENEFTAILSTPLRDAKYQRHSKNNWVLIEKGEGFA